MKPTILWALVANSSYAEIYEVKIGTGEVKSIHHADFVEGRKKMHDLVTDKPGHAYDSRGSMGTGRHAMNEESAFRHHEQSLFAHELVDLCVRGKAEHKFDKLVLIAPPHFLGEIRHVLHAKAPHMPIEKELHKDLPEGLSEQDRVAHVKMYLGL